MAKQGGISRLTMKAMGIFGGVQMMGILCSIIRTKLVALWIGTVGVGLFGLFNNALEMLNIATNLGIRQSSVRDISQASEARNDKLIARIIAVVRKWSLWLGLGGATLTLALAPLLSEITFGTQDHMWGFVALSVAVLLMALTNGEQAVFQGLAQLKKLARITVLGTLSGLLVSIPLFYFLREDSVLPSIIAYAVANAAFAILLRNKDYPRVSVSSRDTVTMGREFVRLGVFMTIGNFVTILATYIFNAWLNNRAGTGVVGLYQAGYTLINKYTGLILTALGMEYYPRLARVAQSRMKLRVFVSQEINIALLVLVPVMAAFVLLRQPIVNILYSKDFLPIMPFISWGMMGIAFRAVSWCMAFVILARGDGKTYLLTETLSAVTGLLLNIVFYNVWGIPGLGWAFTVWYVVYTAIIAVVYFGRYRLQLSRMCLLALIWTVAVTLCVVLGVEGGMLLMPIAIATVSGGVSCYVLLRQWKR
ncbi:MAG: oligosaccharide flippase family protein [Muribaculaceae bacterium]|nr:oligosaccharide flippase family protein [Muribaculaceae bacterium]